MVLPKTARANGPLSAPFGDRTQSLQIRLFMADDADQIDLSEFFRHAASAEGESQWVVIRLLPPRKCFQEIRARLWAAAVADSVRSRQRLGKRRGDLEALSRRQKTYYYPIEISPSALAACAKELGQIDLVSSSP